MANYLLKFVGLREITHTSSNWCLFGSSLSRNWVSEGALKSCRKSQDGGAPDTASDVAPDAPCASGECSLLRCTHRTYAQ